MPGAIGKRLGNMMPKTISANRLKQHIATSARVRPSAERVGLNDGGELHRAGKVGLRSARGEDAPQSLSATGSGRPHVAGSGRSRTRMHAPDRCRLRRSSTGRAIAVTIKAIVRDKHQNRARGDPMLHQELAWFESDAGLVGIIIFDLYDRDFGYVVLRERRGRYKCIDGQTSYSNVEQATGELHKAMETCARWAESSGSLQ